MESDDKKFLQAALLKARESVAKGGFLAGAVIVKKGEIIGEGMSLGSVIHDPTSHGDIAAIRKACGHLKTTDLSGATLYTSLQPCLMCFGAATWGSLRRIVFACAREKVSADYYGGVYSLSQINNGLKSPVELVHLPDLEAETLALIQQWEKSL